MWRGELLVYRGEVNVLKILASIPTILHCSLKRPVILTSVSNFYSQLLLRVGGTYQQHVCVYSKHTKFMFILYKE